MHNELRRLTEQIVAEIEKAIRQDGSKKIVMSQRRFSINIPQRSGRNINWRQPPRLQLLGDIVWDPQQSYGTEIDTYKCVGILAQHIEEKLRGTEWACVNGIDLNWPRYQHEKHRLQIHTPAGVKSGVLSIEGSLETVH